MIQGVGSGVLASTALRLTLIYSSFSWTAAILVHVSYSSQRSLNQSMPEVVNLTVHTGTESPIHLHLRRVPHLDPNLPVYTLGGVGGRTGYRREYLPHKQDLGYYQDDTHGGVILVTRAKIPGTKEVHLVLTGELNISGRKYTLSPETRHKRDSSRFPSHDPSSTAAPASELYSLLPQPAGQVLLHDYVEASPEIQHTLTEDSKLVNPGVYSPTSPTAILPPTTIPTAHSPGNASTPWHPSSRQRRQSQTPQNYFIDVVVVADYGTFQRFQAASQSRADTLQAMREYYSFIYNGVDLRYKSISSTGCVINVRLIKLIIVEDPSGGSFTEQFRVRKRPWDEVDAQSVLTAFSEFVAEPSSSDVIQPYDHVMMFTGYDLTSLLSNGMTTNATTGLAFTSTLCRMDGKSVSVVEDLGGFQAVDTAAHELGHSLSARHDGDGNQCRSTDRYIMASGSSQVTDSNRFNPWFFSPCSIASFTSFIAALVATARGQACLLIALPISADVPDVSHRLPGQEVHPDDQCRMIYGSSSRMCRGSEFGTTSNVCTSMFCFDPGTKGTCYEQTAAMGTSCGNGRLCSSGYCVYDPRAPTVDDDCVFGDQPGTAFEGMTCPDFVRNFGGYCYQTVVTDRCCTSCKKIYRTVTGCEYGDRMRGCSASYCSFATTSYLEQCCGTCNYGSRFTLPPTTGRSPASSTRAGFVANRVSQVQVAATTRDAEICEDNSDAMIDSLPCAEAVAANPTFCDQTDFMFKCCASCGVATFGISGIGAGTSEDSQDNMIPAEETYDNEWAKEEEITENTNDHADKEQESYVEGETQSNEKYENYEREELADEEIKDDWISKSEIEETLARSYVVPTIRANRHCECVDLVQEMCINTSLCESSGRECCGKVNAENFTSAGNLKSGLLKLSKDVSSNA